MRIRTVYLKVGDRAGDAVAWWSNLFGAKPAKAIPPYYEFRVGDINFGLLAIPPASDPPGACVPVFEVSDAEIDAAIARAKEGGATVILEGDDHPDYPNTAAVLRDPFGNEFELTSYHG